MIAAARADSFVLELLDIGVRSTERAGVGHLPDDDRAALDRDIEVISFSNIEKLSGLGWDDDPSEVVDLSCDSTVHTEIPPSGASLQLLGRSMRR